MKTKSIQSVQSVELIFKCKNSLIISLATEYTVANRCIQRWLAIEDKKRMFISNRHISLEEAYERILDELSTLDRRFYAYFDQQKRQASATIDDKLSFAVSGKLIFPMKNLS